MQHIRYIFHTFQPINLYNESHNSIIQTIKPNIIEIEKCNFSFWMCIDYSHLQKSHITNAYLVDDGDDDDE